jgi:small subunit ribosomal protein S16
MVKIRLRRMGSRNHPFYRVVVSDARKTPTGAALDEIGHYDPRKQPAVVSIDRERLDRWVAKGALLSPTVSKLLKQASAAPPVAAPAPPSAAQPVAAQPVAAQPPAAAAAQT